MKGVNPWHQTVWDWRAAIQFICGGTGTGLLLFTTIAAWQDKAWLLRTGPVALALVGAGLLFVWIKLGRRSRALLVFLNAGSSWMTREALLSLPLLGLGLAAVVLGAPAWGLAAAFFGLGYLYAQARILKESRGIPAWREPLIVPLLFSSGLAEGAALMLIAGVVFVDVGEWLRAALLILLAARLGLWWAYRLRIASPGAAPMQANLALAGANLHLVLAGHLAPLILLVVSLYWPEITAVSILFAGLTTLFGGWYFKWILFTRAAYNQGFALEHTPARTPGYSGPGTKPGWG